ncbi:MAG TPA: hypothetical protein VFK02_03635 [Kofleriaceae bacterium]|nr:hypothetical protein [Kofleriaceae bacterium]
MLAQPAAPAPAESTGGGPMFDLIYLVLIVALFVISIAMIRFFDRL